MRHSYLVAYDVRDAARLRRLHRKLLGFGDPLQYSVFHCDLSDAEKLRMVEAVFDVINQGEDRVLIVDVGPSEGRASAAYEFLGVKEEIRFERLAVIV